MGGIEQRPQSHQDHPIKLFLLAKYHLCVRPHSLLLTFVNFSLPPPEWLCRAGVWQAGIQFRLCRNHSKWHKSKIANRLSFPVRAQRKNKTDLESSLSGSVGVSEQVLYQTSYITSEIINRKSEIGNHTSLSRGMPTAFPDRACQLAGKLNWKCKSPRFTGWYLIEKSVSESQRVS